MKNEDYENDYMQNLVDRMNAELNDSGVTVSFEPLNVYDEDDENTEDFSCYSLGNGSALISEYYGDEKEVNIPERINGLEIVGIKNFAFPDNDNIDIINIPKSIEFIDISSFPGVKAFNVDKDNPNYTSCDGVIYNKDMTSLVRYPVRNKRKKFAVPKSVETLEGLSFIGIKRDRLKELYLHKNFKKFDKCVFGFSDKIDDIYYEGLESDWSKVVIEDGNDCLDENRVIKSTIHFNHKEAFDEKSKSSSKKTSIGNGASQKKISETIKNDINENAVPLLNPTHKEAQVIASLKRSFVILEKLDLLKNRLLNEASEEYYDTVLNSMNLLDDVTSTVKTIRNISEDEEILLDFIRNNDIEILANIEENMNDVYNQMQELYDVYSSLWKESNAQKTDQSNTDSVSSSSDTNSGGCYIATCVYGSYDCPQVWTLRRFRDYILAKTWHGRAFIHIYYALAPILVKLFGNTKWFKSVWQSLLDRKIKKLNDDGVENTPYQDIEW